MKLVFALDFGRATMACFYGDCEAEIQEPKPLISILGEPSGSIHLADGSLWLGDQLFLAKGDEVRNISDFNIDIKCMPNDSNRSRQIEYLRAWRNRLMLKYPSLFDNTGECWVIGVPSGWRDTAILEAYRQLFAEAGYPIPLIVHESDAALCYASKTYADMGGLSLGVLCVDMGAYSNDATYIRGGQVSTAGNYVGAALIDRMLLWMNLRDECRLSRKPHNSPELLAEVKRRCEREPKFRSCLLLQARRLKEEYCNRKSMGEPFGRDLCRSVDLDARDDVFSALGEEAFNLYVNDELFGTLVNGRSVRSILGVDFDYLPEETKEELGEKSWKDCFMAFLERSLELCPEWTSQARSGGRDSEPAVLILTGGAAMMPFVSAAVSTVLPNARIRQDTEPMATIARGLWFVKVRDLFIDEIRNRMIDAEGGVLSVIDGLAKDAYEHLWTRISERVGSQAGYCIVEAFCSYDHYENTTGQMIDRAKTWFTGWFDKELPAICLEVEKEARRELNDAVPKAVSKLVREIPGKDRCFTLGDFEQELGFIRESYRVVELVKDRLVADIAAFEKYYQELYDMYADSGRGKSYYIDVDLAWCEKRLRQDRGVFERQIKSTLGLICDRSWRGFAQACRDAFGRAIEKSKRRFA